MQTPFADDYTKEQAVEQCFPDLTADQLALFDVSYTQSADWHSEMHNDQLWLPSDSQKRRTWIIAWAKARGLQAVNVTTAA